MSVSRRAALTAALAVSILLIGGIWLFFRPKPPTPGTAAHEIAQIIEKYSKAPTIALVHADSNQTREAIARTVAEAVIKAPDNREWISDEARQQARSVRVSDDQRTNLSQLFADWITLRADADAEGYIQWMRSRGCELRHDDPSIDDRDGLYEYLSGETYSPDVSPKQLFTTCFEGTLQARDGILRPVTLGEIDVRYGMCDSPNGEIESTLISDRPYLVWWIGEGGVSPGRRHFDAPTTYQQLYDRFGEVLCAVVFSACQGENGAWATCRFYAYWDPFARQWQINSIVSGGLTMDSVGTDIEY